MTSRRRLEVETSGIEDLKLSLKPGDKAHLGDLVENLVHFARRN